MYRYFVDDKQTQRKYKQLFEKEVGEVQQALIASLRRRNAVFYKTRAIITKPNSPLDRIYS